MFGSNRDNQFWSSNGECSLFKMVSIDSDIQMVKKNNEKNILKILQIRKIVVPLQPQSREKAAKSKLNGALVQLVRIHACHAWGHGFESRTHRNKHPALHSLMQSRMFVFYYNAMGLF